MDIGTRVEMHPRTDRWMRGDRFGEIVKVVVPNSDGVVQVKLDKSGKIVRVPLADLTEVT